MLKKLATAEEIRAEIQRRLQAHGAAGCEVPPLLPVNDSTSRANWTVDVAASPTPCLEALTIAVMEAMDRYDLGR
jgi:hypothetical protein